MKITNKTNKRLILAGGLIDGGGAEVRKNVCLVVENGVIAAINPSTSMVREERITIDDFSHCILLPALVDCSINLARSPALDNRAQLTGQDASPAEKFALLARHVEYCHAHGVLGVAHDGDDRNLVKRYLEGRHDGDAEIVIRTAGRLTTVQKNGPARGNADGDFLRIAYSAGIADENNELPGPDHAELCRLLGRRNGRKAVVIANGERQVAEAIEAGCDAIEQGYAMGEENLRKMAEKNILWIPSILQAKNALDGVGSGGDVCCRFSLRYVAPGKAVPGGEAFWKKVVAAQLAQLRQARTIGVPCAVGTGAGSMGILHGESVVEEMKLFIKAGFSLGETIRAASENGARFFGMDDLGALTVGARATFLITRGTAQQLPRKLSYLEAIYVGGAPSTVYRKNPIKAVHE